MGFLRTTVGRDITGENQARAAQSGAAAQERLGREAIDLQRENAAQIREDLDPFRQFGVGLLGQAEQLFGGNAGEQIINDPVFQALSGEARRQIESRQAARGRTFIPETDQALQDSFLRTGSQLLGQRQGNLLQALGLGQSSAAQQAAGGTQAAGNIANLLTQIGNAQAGGLTAAAGARAAGTGNLLQLAGSMFSDRRVKDNIKAIGEEKGYVVYEYTYVWDEDTVHVGVMAQDVEKINPGAVYELGGVKVVNYARL